MTDVVKESVQIINKLGLHARAATRLVNEASAFESSIFICRGEQQADAKSIMSIMMLAASQGTNLEIVADGKDEEIALRSLIELIENRFGEEE